MQGLVLITEDRFLPLQPALPGVRNQPIPSRPVQQSQRPLHPQQCKSGPMQIPLKQEGVGSVQFERLRCSELTLEMFDHFEKERNWHNTQKS